jgi:hypothetical protein
MIGGQSGFELESGLELEGGFDGVIPSAAVLRTERGISVIVEPVGTCEISRADRKNAALRNNASARGEYKLS